MDVGTAMSVAQNLLAALQCSELKEICSIAGYKSTLDELRATVVRIKAVLKDAEAKQELSVQEQLYIEELMDAVYEADDLFDEFVTLAERKQLTKGIKARVFSIFTKFGMAYKITQGVKKIKNKLDAICDAEENQQNRDQANFHVSLSTTSITNSIPKTLGNRDFLKWVFVVLNVVFEICQATFSQVKNQGKMGPNIYFKLSIITSSICLMMAILETFHEAKGAGIVWRKRGYCCWFHYPGNEGRLFGRISLYFGLISSMIQLIINLQEKLTNKDIVKFDYIPLLLAICYLVAAIIGAQEKTPSAIRIRCNVHGSSVVEGTIVEGHESRVFQCPHCQREREEDRVLHRC